MDGDDQAQPEVTMDTSETRHRTKQLARLFGMPVILFMLVLSQWNRLPTEARMAGIG